jgi:predicted transcriptional regulator
MQQYTIHPILAKLYKRGPVDDNFPPEAMQLKKKLKDCRDLLQAKVKWDRIKEILGISKSTYYRIKTQVKTLGVTAFIGKSKKPHSFRQSKVPQDVVNLVLSLRKANPTYGKSKLVVILKRDHKIKTSESTVGRILGKLIASGKVEKYSASRTVKRRRKFVGHAAKWQYGMKATAPGEMIQVDHMTVTKNQITFKHFQAWDPITKVIVAEVVSDAKSCTAAKFLRKVVKEMPFAVKSVQVDGGSEFMKDFESECAKHKLPLYVLPPKRPQFNGGVERGNRIFREEFYARKDVLADTVGHMKGLLAKAVSKYNTFRPHYSLKGLTPYEYNASLSSGARKVSYVLN